MQLRKARAPRSGPAPARGRPVPGHAPASATWPPIPSPAASRPPRAGPHDEWTGARASDRTRSRVRGPRRGRSGGRRGCAEPTATPLATIASPGPAGTGGADASTPAQLERVRKNGREGRTHEKEKQIPQQHRPRSDRELSRLVRRGNVVQAVQSLEPSERASAGHHTPKPGGVGEEERKKKEKKLTSTALRSAAGAQAPLLPFPCPTDAPSAIRSSNKSSNRFSPISSSRRPVIASLLVTQVMLRKMPSATSATDGTGDAIKLNESCTPR